MDNTSVSWIRVLEALARPFPARWVQWRAGAVSRDRKRAQALPFVDPRQYEDRLNRTVGGQWEVHFRPWGETRLVCELTILGVTRSSTGEFDSGDRISQGTTAEAQAFKRACSKFGLGRYLYEIPVTWVTYDQERSRLLETPELPGKWAPVTDEEAQAILDPTEPAQVASPKHGPEKLTPERAQAMGRELEKLGIERSSQIKFAAATVGRGIRALTDLTDAEALEVWNVARRTSRDPSEPSAPTDQGGAGGKRAPTPASERNTPTAGPEIEPDDPPEPSEAPSTPPSDDWRGWGGNRGNMALWAANLREIGDDDGLVFGHLKHAKNRLERNLRAIEILGTLYDVELSQEAVAYLWFDYCLSRAAGQTPEDLVDQIAKLQDAPVPELMALQDRVLETPPVDHWEAGG